MVAGRSYIDYYRQKHPETETAAPTAYKSFGRIYLISDAGQLPALDARQKVVILEKVAPASLSMTLASVQFDTALSDIPALAAHIRTVLQSWDLTTATLRLTNTSMSATDLDTALTALRQELGFKYRLELILPADWPEKQPKADVAMQNIFKNVDTFYYDLRGDTAPLERRLPSLNIYSVSFYAIMDKLPNLDFYEQAVGTAPSFFLGILAPP